MNTKVILTIVGLASEAKEAIVGDKMNQKKKHDITTKAEVGVAIVSCSRLRKAKKNPQTDIVTQSIDHTPRAAIKPKIVDLEVGIREKAQLLRVRRLCYSLRVMLS